MSIGELATVVNSNFNKPINEQIRELAYSGSYLITGNRNFSPSKTGWYKIIVVSSGGDAYEAKGRSGSSGGVAIATRRLDKNNTYTITKTGSEIAFDDIICINAKNSTSSAYGAIGTASGGDMNYDGSFGTSSGGADIGVFIPQLMETTKNTYAYDSAYIMVESGLGILGYGGGQTIYNEDIQVVSPNKGGCVLIIPLEFEE